MGHWLSKAHIGERGGVNLCGMCGSYPVNFTDFLGFWTQLDKKMARATFEAEKGDTIQTLAAKRGLTDSACHSFQRSSCHA